VPRVFLCVLWGKDMREWSFFADEVSQARNQRTASLAESQLLALAGRPNCFVYRNSAAIHCPITPGFNPHRICRPDGYCRELEHYCCSCGQPACGRVRGQVEPEMDHVDL